MAKTLRIIPFDQGSTSTVLSTVTGLFMFLIFLSHGFYTLFAPGSALLEAQKAPGYVLLLPEDGSGAVVQGTSTFEARDILFHVFSSLPNVVSYHEVTLKDLAPVLGYIDPQASGVSYIDLRLSSPVSGAQNDGGMLLGDIQALTPDVQIYDRQAFFEQWIDRLNGLAMGCRFITVMTAFGLAIALMVLLGNAFRLHEGTLQTLRYLGASQAYIVERFRRYFQGRFVVGALLGLGIACLVYIPFSLILSPAALPHELFGALVMRVGVQALVAYGGLLAVMAFGLSFYGKRLV